MRGRICGGAGCKQGTTPRAWCVVEERTKNAPQGVRPDYFSRAWKRGALRCSVCCRRGLLLARVEESIMPEKLPSKTRTTPRARGREAHCRSQQERFIATTPRARGREPRQPVSVFTYGSLLALEERTEGVAFEDASHLCCVCEGKSTAQKLKSAVSDLRRV